MRKPNYFFVSVSTRQHLELCIRHAMAGFTNSVAGAWTFVEIREGDLISFLYAARAYNLYKVIGKEAVTEFKKLPPRPPVTFRESGRIYYFPFRLRLEPIREFCEPLVRPEFAYVAENLLLRGGYRRSHFQADQTTLQNVWQMGHSWNKPVEPIVLSQLATFVPKFVNDKSRLDIPFICPFQEIILQSALRHYLSEETNLNTFLEMTDLGHLSAEDLEVLGEKALAEGHVDILIKDRVPITQVRKIVVEVKLRRASRKDIEQLCKYMQEIGDECIAGVLIAEDFHRSAYKEAAKHRIRLVRYRLDTDLQLPQDLDTILANLHLELDQ